jgi:transposase
MSVYVGIDVHRKRSQVAVVTEEGKVRLKRNVVNGAEPVLTLIGGLPAGTPVAFEAAFGWGWLVGLLENYGFEAHLVPPLRCTAIASARLKNDKAGAAALAQLLRADLLPGAWIAPPEVRQLRALLRHRVGLVRAGTQARNRIHAVVADFGYDRAGTYRAGPDRGWLAELGLPPVSRRIVTDCLTVIDALEVTIGQLDVQVRARAKADPRVKTLTAVPGVGQFTALVMLAEIGDITRFGNARKLASWAGLTPTVRGSDRTVRHGHISKQGSVWLRWVLGQAAQTAKRSPQFAPAYAAIAARRGTKIATMAVARKLLTRACHLLAAPAAGAAGPAEDRAGHQPRVSSLKRHEPASGALDHLTEQPGPRTHGHGARQSRRARRMGACQTTPPTTHRRP